jgi:hypothetical protein
MRLTEIGANQTLMTMENGTIVLFSYSSPVAAFIPGRGYVRSENLYGLAAIRHVNDWIKDKDCSIVEQSVIDDLVRGWK